MGSRALMVLFFAFASAGTGLADDCEGPCVDFHGSWELDFDGIHSSSSAVGGYYDLYPSLETEVNIRNGHGLSLNSDFVLEPVIDINPGSSRLVEDVGLYLKWLYVQYDSGDLSIFAGKIHPIFARAWDIAPGVYGGDLVGNYELDERLGGGASYSFQTGDFSNRIEASVFTVDRSVLSNSLFTARGQKTISDGGAGNTNGFSSVAVALDGCKGADPDSCYDDGSLGYQIAVSYQKAGTDGIGDERGIATSLNKTFKLSEDTDLKLLGEVAYFDHFDGGEQNALFFTGSTELDIEQIALSTAYTQQRLMGGGIADEMEYLVDATIAYKLDDSISLAGESWTISLGYSFDRTPDEDNQKIGLQFTADFDGSRKF